MIKTWNGLPWIVKVILQFFLGYFVSIIYRILLILKKASLTNILGLIMSFFVIGWWVDFFTVLFTGKIFVLAE